jgi:hypothetical protein
MANELTRMPAAFAAGTTVNLRLSFSDFLPSAGWALKLYLVANDPAGSFINGGIAATVSGADFLIVIPAATIAAFASGLYTWSLIATNGADVEKVDSGQVVLTVNMATAIAGGGQTADEKELVAVRAQITALVTGGIEAYQIENEGVTLLPLDQLQAREKQLMIRLNRKNNNGPFAKSVRLHAVRPGCGQ